MQARSLLKKCNTRFTTWELEMSSATSTGSLNPVNTTPLEDTSSLTGIPLSNIHCDLRSSTVLRIFYYVLHGRVAASFLTLCSRNLLGSMSVDADMNTIQLGDTTLFCFFMWLTDQECLCYVLISVWENNGPPNKRSPVLNVSSYKNDWSNKQSCS